MGLVPELIFVLRREIRQGPGLLTEDGGQIVENFVNFLATTSSEIGVAIEDALHVGRLRAGCEDIAVKLFRWTRLVGERLTDHLREDICDRPSSLGGFASQYSRAAEKLDTIRCAANRV
jgi:hypothetical protein